MNQLGPTDTTTNHPHDCDHLGTAANQAGDRVIKQYNQQDISYDRRTKHGATQGAVFP